MKLLIPLWNLIQTYCCTYDLFESNVLELRERMAQTGFTICSCDS